MRNEKRVCETCGHEYESYSDFESLFVARCEECRRQMRFEQLMDSIEERPEYIITPMQREIDYTIHADESITLRIAGVGDVACANAAEAAGVLLDM